MTREATITLYRSAELPPTIHGAVIGLDDNRYTIILNANDTPARQFAAFLHEVTHLYNGDLEAGGDVQEIETRTHRQLLEALESIKEDMHKS